LWDVDDAVHVKGGIFTHHDGNTSYPRWELTLRTLVADVPNMECAAVVSSWEAAYSFAI
jgi:hypothetical protein